MDYHFKPCDRNQMLLLPPSLDEWLPESHLSRFIVDAVGPFDLAEFMAQYRSDGTGQAAFHPAPVLALLLYWYCKGERSSRKIESYCEDDVASRFIMAHLKPDHSMFCRFRARHQSAIAKLFVQVLQLCEKAGLVKLGSVSLDGTKIKASAALDANRKHRGRKPKLPDEVVDKDQKANATDPHSRIMKTRSGYVQGYNAQAVVSEEQIVLENGLLLMRKPAVMLREFTEGFEVNGTRYSPLDDLRKVVSTLSFHGNADFAPRRKIGSSAKPCRRPLRRVAGCPNIEP